MIYITGDTHGDINRFSSDYLPGEELWTENDYLIVCGDFGLIFYDDKEEKEQLDNLSEKPYTILWVCGNHENFNALYKYPIEIWNGGKVHRIRKNIFHLMRGQIFNINGKKFFTFGGAYSIDRYMRVKNKSYWEEELPNDEEYNEAIKNLNFNDKTVDYIITHTAPKEIVRRMGYYPDPHDMQLTGFLEWVMYEVSYSKWFFGHWHEDKEIDNKHRALYYDVVEV
ncbi:MAG: metallophosphoesterase [Acutalibacteraceae bacterium]